jgi:hypothetical protein
MIRNAYAESTQRSAAVAMGCWYDFVQAMVYERPDMLRQPRWGGDADASMHNELSLMYFAAWGDAQGLAPATIGTYTSLVKTTLAMAFGWALTCEQFAVRLPRLMKGLRRTRKLVRKKRLGWRARYERLLRDKIGEPVEWEGWTQKAMRTTARQGLLRGADFLPERASSFDPERHAMVRDLEHFMEPTPHYRLTVLPAKKSEQQGKTEYVYLPKGDGVTDAYSALEAMLRCRGIGKEDMRHSEEALFMHEDGESKWTCRQFRAHMAKAGLAVGITSVKMTCHSGRIGGATDAFASGCDPIMMQMQGRWDSVRGNRTRDRTHKHTP